MFDEKDLIFMKEALVEAELAFKEEEVPVGAVIVSPEGKIIGKRKKSDNKT
jgi:tRNA(adenine34) deaminase